MAKLTCTRSELQKIGVLKDNTQVMSLILEFSKHLQTFQKQKQGTIIVLKSVYLELDYYYQGQAIPSLLYNLHNLAGCCKMMMVMMTISGHHT
jgi:hypothetical protein